jgi:5'-methylthioadenosine phosphorylase
MEFPQCPIGLIGGSSTLSRHIPRDIDFPAAVMQEGIKFATPYGESPAFTHLSLRNAAGATVAVLTCDMHGWRRGVTRADASRQVFWVFERCGVRKVISEGGVGAVNYLLNLEDLVLPHDYMDFSMRKDVELEGKYLLIMRDAICPSSRAVLAATANVLWPKRVFERGVYVNTDGRHFESPAEVSLFKSAGGDIIGQSLVPEVYLAREIGACYVSLQLVVNYAEGIVAPWQHEELSRIFYDCGAGIGKILLQAIGRLDIETECGCQSLRQETLLKGIYD